MTDETFNDRRKAAAHFSKQDQAVGFFADESGELKKIVKSDQDASALTHALRSLASSELQNIPTSMDDIDAIKALAKRFNYSFEVSDIRTLIAREKQRINSDR